jgi:hypothetical protein
VSAAVHGYYQRTVRDAPLAGLPVLIRLRMRRFRCRALGCERRTFAEQIDGLTTPHSRQTPPLRAALTAIAVALAGRAGARLATTLGMPTGRDTTLRLLRALPDPQVGEVAVLGVDDFALRRGHVYATILLDMATHRPIDVLPGRDAEPLAEWLHAHPGVQIICRDRAGAYAEGARAGAPDAVQVADRWHLFHNLGEAVDKTVTTHHACIRAHAASIAASETVSAVDEPVPAVQVTPAVSGPPPGHGGELDVCGRERALVTRTRDRYVAVQDLVAAGHSLGAICVQLGLDRGTVRRFARAANVDELLVKATNRISVLDGHTEHLLARFTAGVTDTAVLLAELRERGYTGSVQTIRRYLHPLRDTTPEQATARPRPAVPKPRRITRWIMTDPERLDPDDLAQLAIVTAACPELAAVAGHVREFADLMNKHRGDRINTWIEQVLRHASRLSTAALIEGGSADAEGVVPGPVRVDRPRLGVRRG